MIRLYFDTSLRIPGKSYETFPLLEQLELDRTVLSQYFVLVNGMKSADMTLVPMNLQYLFQQGKKMETLAFIDESLANRKEVLVFSGGDFGVSLNREGVHTIRLGGFHSKMDAQSYIMPPFIEDPYRNLDTITTSLPKREKPSIGFVGHSNGSVGKYFKELSQYFKGNFRRNLGKDATDAQSFYPSSIRRHRYLKRLETIPDIETNFIYRKQYRAGVRTEIEKQKTTREFYQNIHDNLFTFCLRGTGNFSVRFYETLGMGRIPVVVNTDCRFPFSNRIDWKKHCVIVEEREVATLAEAILHFYHNHSEAQLKAIQEENRRIWKGNFERDTYFANIANLLEQK